jgi:tripartite-type tricarboxylate transporter receptor subunit TctC
MASCAIRTFLAFIVVAIGQMPLAYAQPAAFPNRPITLVVPTSAGGGVDAIARLIAVQIGKDLGQAVVVENRPGAGGNIGTLSVARAPSDGYTLIFISSTQLIAQMTASAPFDLFSDFVPIGLVADASEVIAISSRVAANDLKEFAEAARARTSMFNYATPGIGTVPHLGAEMLARALKIKMVNVPFRGSMEGFRELAAGNVEMSIATLPSVAPFMDSNNLVKIIAVAGPKRLEALPNVPTTAESGYPGVNIAFWAGVLAPKGVDKEIQALLSRSLNKALADPKIRSVLSKQAIDPVSGESEAFTAKLKEYAELYRSILTEIDLGQKK